MRGAPMRIGAVVHVGTLLRRIGTVAGLTLTAQALVGIAALANAAVDPGKAVAPRMEFVAPAPGSYRLQKIQRVADAVMLDTAGHSVQLDAVTKGKITLLTFF